MQIPSLFAWPQTPTLYNFATRLRSRRSSSPSFCLTRYLSGVDPIGEASRCAAIRWIQLPRRNNFRAACAQARLIRYSPDHDKLTDTTMQNEILGKCRRKFLYASGAALLFGAAGFSQDAASDDDEEVFELSPFTVEGSENVGYRATSTLAGARIRTDLKDVGSAISGYTEQFFKDVGAIRSSRSAQAAPISPSTSITPSTAPPRTSSTCG